MRKPDDPIVSTEPGEERSFYGRWSRRKHLARTGQSLPEAPDPHVLLRQPEAQAQPLPVSDAEPDAEPGAELESGEPAPPELTDADMPALETLGADDDYSGFMSPGVSEALRAKALRKLFMSSKFNVVDGLNDYDDDFTTFEALGDIITSDMRHRMEVEAEKARAKAEEEAEREASAAPAEDAEAAPAAQERADAAVEDTRGEHSQLPDGARVDGGSVDERPEGDDSTDAGDPRRDG